MRNLIITGQPNAVQIRDGCVLTHLPCRNATVRIRHGQQGLNILAAYSPKHANNACWSLGIQQAHDGALLPEWPWVARNSQDCLFSGELEVSVPEGARVVVETDDDVDLVELY